MNEILKYFPDLTERQQAQMAALYDLYADWNQKINVISRKDIEHLYEHHVLHSLAIARFVKWKEGTKVLDFGTGGGFPGIPLAILYPDCQFHLIDGTGKKIRVVNEVVQVIGLKNVKASHLRGEDEKGKYDFVVSRAVMPLPSLVRIVSKNISKTQRNAIANGVICLKGGDVGEETQPFGRVVETADISEWFDEEWFNEKHIIYLPL
ncbi:MAG: 16S rRNA (guanine(527)-N(7))-methyltransferase RsmG [Prevotella sp.]|nr:16S rRNA (guanine(527)-N(7))-methyltransferase RsmG [Prevotella sp.]